MIENMFDKTFLINKLMNSLISQDFQISLSAGCFDIAARREYLMLVKSLINVDSLDKKQALNLKAVSYFASALPMVVSVKNNRDFMQDDIVYSRFDLPVVTPNKFDEIIKENSVEIIKSAKGRHTVKIDIEKMREKRENLGLSQKGLSEIVGISKKAVYEIETGRVNPGIDTINKIQDALRIGLISKQKFEKNEKPIYLKPESEFQKKISKEFSRIGVDNSSLSAAPFEIIGKEKYSLITNLSIDEKRSGKNAKIVKSISSVFASKAVIVSKRTKEENIEGIPVVLESELPEIKNPKELKKIMEEKSE